MQRSRQHFKRDKRKRLILFNKPFNVLCQFSGESGDRLLKDYIDIPEVYPAGRLDKDSEGLLLLTNDGKLQAQITQPKYKLPKTYWVQVEGRPEQPDLNLLRQGIKVKNDMFAPADVKIISEPELWERVPPIRFRKKVQTSWLEITIREGKNRQVRRMTASIGFPTLRLVRAKIGTWELDSLMPGQYKEIKL